MGEANQIVAILILILVDNWRLSDSLSLMKGAHNVVCELGGIGSLLPSVLSTSSAAVRSILLN